MVKVTGSALRGVDGTLLSNVPFKVILRDMNGGSNQMFDATTQELISGSHNGVTDSNGNFSVNLWENYKGFEHSYYQITFNHIISYTFSISSSTITQATLYSLVTQGREISNAEKTTVYDYVDSQITLKLSSALDDGTRVISKQEIWTVGIGKMYDNLNLAIIAASKTRIVSGVVCKIVISSDHTLDYTTKIINSSLRGWSIESEAFDSVVNCTVNGYVYEIRNTDGLLINTLLQCNNVSEGIYLRDSDIEFTPGSGAINSAQNGLLSELSNVVAEGTIWNGTGPSGVTIKSGRASLVSASASGNLKGFRVDGAAMVNLSNSVAENCREGLVCYGNSIVNADSSNFSKATKTGVYASGGSRVSFWAGKAYGYTVNGIKCDTGSEIQACNSTCRKDGTDSNNSGTVDSATDMVVLTGSIIRANTTIGTSGGGNIPFNTITSNGIIFK